MSVQRLSPEGLIQPVPYHHVAIGSGSRLVYVAGQTARAADRGPLTTDDLAEQVVRALRNVGTAIAGAGATFADVVHLTCYVTGWSPSRRDAFEAGFARAAAELGFPDPLPPFTLVGVEKLYEPDILVEIQATAVVD